MRVQLNGYVCADEDLKYYEHYNYPAFGPATIRQALQDNPEGEELVLEVNSFGGSAWSGAEIYTVLRSSPVHTRAEIQSLAASAASYLVLGCDSVWISPVAQMMAHLPAMYTGGNQDDHQHSIDVLNAMTESILNAYVAKSRGKKTREELSAMMHATSWLTAQEALDAGLVDGILYQNEDGEYAPGAIVNALGDGIRSLTNGLTVPDLAELRARYEAETQNPAGGPPADNHTDWQAQAALEIEKNRFMEVTT